MKETRKLIDLVSVGPATIDDFNLLGIKSVKDLIDKKAETLYAQLQQWRGEKIDICCLDVFRCAIEQARNPNLPEEKCQWWYWSRARKNNYSQ